MKSKAATDAEKKPGEVTLSAAVKQFDDAPDSMLIDITTAGAIADRSRASIYRHFRAGELTMVKIGSSTRIKVGELRRLIGA